MARSPRLDQLPSEVQEAIASGRWSIFATNQEDIFAIKTDDAGVWFLIDAEGKFLESLNKKPESISNPILMPFGSIQKFLNRTAANS